MGAEQARKALAALDEIGRAARTVEATAKRHGIGPDMRFALEWIEANRQIVAHGIELLATAASRQARDSHTQYAQGAQSAHIDDEGGTDGEDGR